MADVQTVLHIAGIRAALKSDGVRRSLASLVDPMAARANAMAAANADNHTQGAQYRAYVDLGRYTAIGKVVCGNAAARHDNSHNNTLLKAR